jgi:hypothetical protein
VLFFYSGKEETEMNLSTGQLLEIAQYSLIRLDGAWFMALAGKLGEKTAWLALTAILTVKRF